MEPEQAMTVALSRLRSAPTIRASARDRRPPPPPDQGRQHALPRRRGDRVRRQVGHRLRRRSARGRCAAKLSRRSAREPEARVRRRARDRRRDRLLLAQPAAARADRAARPRPTSPRGCWRRSRRAPSGSGWRSRRSARRPSGCRSPTRASTSSSATPSCTTSPTSRGAFGEFHRVLRPGGMVAFCGEPSRYGDRIAALPKRAGDARWRRSGAAWSAPRRRPSTPEDACDGHELEPEVDVHAFAPAELAELAERRRLRRVRLRGEELLANAYGWLLRTLEATAEPERGPLRLAAVRVSQLPRAAAPRHRRCSSPVCRRSSSTTSCCSARRPAERVAR